MTSQELSDQEMSNHEILRQEKSIEEERRENVEIEDVEHEGERQQDLRQEKERFEGIVPEYLNHENGEHEEQRQENVEQENVELDVEHEEQRQENVEHENVEHEEQRQENVEHQNAEHEEQRQENVEHENVEHGNVRLEKRHEKENLNQSQSTLEEQRLIEDQQRLAEEQLFESDKLSEKSVSSNLNSRKALSQSIEKNQINEPQINLQKRGTQIEFKEFTDNSSINNGNKRSTTQQDSTEESNVCIKFAILDKNAWKLNEVLFIKSSESAKVEEIAKKKMREKLKIYDSHFRALGSKDCWEAATGLNCNTLFLIPESEQVENIDELLSIAYDMALSLNPMTPFKRIAIENIADAHHPRKKEKKRGKEIHSRESHLRKTKNTTMNKSPLHNKDKEAEAVAPVESPL